MWAHHCGSGMQPHTFLPHASVYFLKTMIGKIYFFAEKGCAIRESMDHLDFIYNTSIYDFI